jgi:hypothetical protein
VGFQFDVMFIDSLMDDVTYIKDVEQWYDDTQIQLLTCQKQVIIAHFTDKTALLCGHFEGFTSQLLVIFHNFISSSDNQRKAGGNFITLHKKLNNLQDLRVILTQQRVMSLPT